MKALHPTSLKHSLLLVGATLLAVPSLQATLLVYEGFDYGGSAIANIHDTAGTATGTQGNWTVTNVIPSGGAASSAYQSTGLSFGSNFATSSGGALLQTTRYSGANAQTSATLRLNTTTTGTLWGSYLVNYTALALAGSGAAVQGIGTDSTGATVNLGNRVNTNTVATSRTTSAFYDNSLTTSGATAFLTGTNYLVLSRFTNVGTTLSAGAPGVATVWYFTQSDYDNWITTGGGLESNLTAYAFKTQTDSVTSGLISFSDSGYLTLKTDAPDNNTASQGTAVYDELRYGTDLSDVVGAAVPEPSSYAALAGLAALVGSICLRRRSNRSL